MLTIKVIFPVIALLVCHTVTAQFYLGPEIGHTDANFTVGLKTGFRTNSNFLIEGMMRTHMDRVHPAYFAALLGYRINVSDDVSIIPLAGYCLSYISSDVKSLNKNIAQYAVRVQWNKVFLEGDWNKQSPCISIGFTCFSRE